MPSFPEFGNEPEFSPYLAELTDNPELLDDFIANADTATLWEVTKELQERSDGEDFEGADDLSLILEDAAIEKPSDSN